MLISGYEKRLSDPLRYWRTRFIVIPTAERPQITVGPQGEPLNDEEIRIFGIERLAELFTKLRWIPPGEESVVPSPIRFLHTTLSPVASVLDDSIVSQLE